MNGLLKNRHVTRRSVDMNMLEPALINISIDRLFLTIQLNLSEGDRVREMMMQSGKCIANVANEERYQNGVAETIPGSDSELKVFYKKDREGTDGKLCSTVSIRFNPGEHSTASMMLLFERVRHYLGDDVYREIFLRANVTAIDYAFDYVGISPDDCFFILPEKQVIGIFSNEDGITETLYQGTGNNRCKTYNKTEEIKAKPNKKTQFKLNNSKQKRDVPGLKVCRIECTNEPHKPLGEYLKSMSLPSLAKMEVYAISSVEDAFHLNPDFVDSCKYRGIQSALKRQPKKTHKVISKVLEILRLRPCLIEDEAAVFREVTEFFGLLSFDSSSYEDIFLKYPKLLGDYIHRGYMTEQLWGLLAPDEKLSKKMKACLGYPNCSASHIKDQTMGMPITKKLAHELLHLRMQLEEKKAA